MTEVRAIIATPHSIAKLENVGLGYKLASRIALSLKTGALTVHLPDGRSVRYAGEEPGCEAVIIARHPRFARRILTGGVMGVAESYIDGDWDTPDLAKMLQLFAENFDAMRPQLLGNPVLRMMNRLAHLLRPNTRSGSRKNIYAHYDLGNAFYSAWLDQTMTYSSALYDRDGQALAEAQRNKYRALADQIDLASDQHVLEIGCGWGGFAEYAAKERGARVTGLTISREQHDFAQKRMFENQLADKVDIRLVDYRDVEGRYDRVASIEMFEAVGEKYWPQYFAKVHDVLTPGGRAGLQIITIRDDLFEGYRSSVDFIQKYIFPGGMLPSPERLKEEFARAGLTFQDARSFGQHYADTLAEWTKSFAARWEDIRQLGFDERFRRLWNFYLAYCEAGFRTERTDVAQFAVSKA